MPETRVQSPILEDWSNWAHVPQLLNLCSRVPEPQLLSSRVATTEAFAPRALAQQQEKPLQWEDSAARLEASLVTQLVKNPPAMQETWVRSLGREDPLEKGKATHSSILS